MNPSEQPNTGSPPVTRMPQPSTSQTTQGQQRMPQQGTSQMTQGQQRMPQQGTSQMTPGQQRMPQQGTSQGTSGQHRMPQLTQQQMRQHAQQQQILQQQLREHYKLDEDAFTLVPKLYNKVKALMGPLRTTLTDLLTIAAQSIQHNSEVDTSAEATEPEPLATKFNQTIEKFYSICDQIEYYLKTLMEIRSLSSCSERYNALPVITPRNERSMGNKPALTYRQFIMNVKNQVAYAQTVHDALMSVAKSLALDGK